MRSLQKTRQRLSRDGYETVAGERGGGEWVRGEDAEGAASESYQDGD